MKIAILDDNPGIGRILQLNLENAGHETHVFQTVKDFFDFLAIHRGVDLIITDFRLMTEQGKSNLSGADVIRLVKRARPDMPAILISAATMFELEEATSDILDVYILQKSFKMSLLLETIQALKNSFPKKDEDE